jgi:hypothetical protein
MKHYSDLVRTGVSYLRAVERKGRQDPERIDAELAFRRALAAAIDDVTPLLIGSTEPDVFVHGCGRSYSREQWTALPKLEGSWNDPELDATEFRRCGCGSHVTFQASDSASPPLRESPVESETATGGAGLPANTSGPSGVPLLHSWIEIGVPVLYQETPTKEVRAVVASEPRNFYGRWIADISTEDEWISLVSCTHIRPVPANMR